MRSLIILVVFFIFCNSSLSQSLAPDTSSLPAFKKVLTFYSKSFGNQLHIYNGKEYRPYRRPFDEGQPYFVTDKWSKGTVSYDGNQYDDVSILYNLVTDELIILDYNDIAMIELLKEKVAGFSVSGHSFLNITHDSLYSADIKEGFYDVLAGGRAALLVKRSKNIQSFIKRSIELKVFAKEQYYLKKDKHYFSLNGQKSLLEHLDDKRNEIQQYIKQNRLRFRKEPEETMTKIVDYYNQLTR